MVCKVIIKNLSFSGYQDIKALNNSSLSAFRSCPARYKYMMDNPREDTEALKLGRAIHTAVLQPELFNEEFFCMPEIDRRTTKGKEAYNELLVKFPGKTLLKAEEFAKAMQIATAVRCHKAAIRLLRDSHCEVTATWKDSNTDVECKARIDAHNQDYATICDLKTTTDASPSGFPRKLWSYGYHRQAAWYLEAMQANKEAAEHFVFIAVEKEPPYPVGVYRLDDEAIRLSRAENHALLRRFAECRRTNTWPDYTTGVETISIPQFGINQLEEDYGDGESL